MVTLRRTVRFAVNPQALRPGEGGANGFAGRPALRGLGRWYEVEVACRGEPDPGTGYLVNIKTIDDAVRRTLVPEITRACDLTPEADPAAILPALASSLAAALTPVRVAAVRWWLSPYFSVETDEMETKDPRVLLRQRFDLAAAHRLHVAALTAEENRALFGKCNNPSGHGHNYRVEPCVSVAPGSGFDIAALEELTERLIVQPFDHTHLNEDTAAFGPTGLNPSVEHIARVFFERLAPAVREAGGDLRDVTVWETDRTSACYPG